MRIGRVGSPHRRSRVRVRPALVLGAFVCALCAVILSPLAGSSVPGSGGRPAGSGQDDDGDPVDIQGPSYLEPILAPYVTPDLVETIPVPPLEVISRRSDVPGDLVGGWSPSLSADGRFVVFTTYVPGSDSQTTVMLRDRVTGTLTELTPPLAEFPSRSSAGGVLSADGCVVAVATTIPYDVFRDDDGGERWDVYRKRLPTCSSDLGTDGWELMSTAPSGSDAALNTVDPQSRLAVSGAGTVIAFRTVDRERFGGPQPLGSVLVADATVALGTASRVVAVPGLPATSAAGQAFVAGFDAPALSRDGRSVAFVSDARADLATPEWAGGPDGGAAITQVYVWTRGTARPVLVSADASGAPLANGAAHAAISGDGRRVAFVARAEAGIDGAAGLNGSCERCPANVFVVDRDADGNGLLDDVGAPPVGASASAGALGNGDSTAPVFALGGRLVGFLTKASNLAPGAVGNAGTFVVTDLATGSITVGSLEAGGQRPAAVLGGWPALSDNGRNVVAESTSPGVLGAPVVGTVGTQVVAISATPAVRLADVDVGTSFVNEQVRRTTTLSNIGPGPFVPAAISSTSTAVAVSGGTCAVGVPVGAGQTCTVDLVFTAAELGSATAQLVVSERGIGAVTVTANVTGSGGVPKIVGDPPTVTYADALVGAGAETLSVVIRNVGVGPMLVSTTLVGGTHPADFAVQADGCTNVTVPEQGACVVRVVFAPTTSGTRSAVVVVTAADGSVARATLSGRGYYAPTVTVTPRAVESGARVRLTGAGFPADVDVSVAWEGMLGQLVRTDATGAFEVLLSTTGVVPGARHLRVADAVPAGATQRYEPVRSDIVYIAEASGGLDPTSPAFDDVPD